MRDRFREAGLATPELDARLLAQAAFDIDAMSLIRHERDVLPEEWGVALDRFAERRLAGEPVSRIIGRREFWGLDFELNSATLDPRPETEMLVADLVAFGQSRPELYFIDLGTGTGAIALALLSQERRAQAVASDISADALATACANADINGVGERFSAVRSHWFDAIGGRFHVIVSNPPYIPSKDIASLERDVRDYDPLAALDGGDDGLDAYRSIAAGCKSHLEDNGVVAVEIGHDQAADVESIFEHQGLRLEQTARDLGGVMRALLFRVRKP